MVNVVSGPIVAVNRTAEGVIVKAKELIEAILDRGDRADVAENDVEQGEAETEVAPAPDRRNRQQHPSDV